MSRVEAATSRRTGPRDLVRQFGGSFSGELGIDLDAGPVQVERWFLASTLFGTRIPTGIALRTYQTMAQAGVRTIADAGRRTWAELVDLLDRGGYVRYDYKTASRLLDLATALGARYPEGISALSTLAPGRLETELDALPGWGPVTIRLFLRELRGVWAGAEIPIDPRALATAREMHLRPPRRAQLAWLRRQAKAAGIDVRDLEGALVRASLRRRRRTIPAVRPLRQPASHAGRRSGLASGRRAISRPAHDRPA